MLGARQCIRRRRYRCAILEVNVDKLGARVRAAEKAIRSRTLLDTNIPSDERIASNDSVSALSIRKREPS